MIEIYSWSLWEFPFLPGLPSQLEWGGIQYQGREAAGPCVSTVAFAVMYFVLSKPQMLVHTCSCGIVACSQLHSFLSSLSLSSFCTPFGHLRTLGDPCAYIVGVSQVRHCLWAPSGHTSNYSAAPTPMLGCVGIVWAFSSPAVQLCP